MRGQFFRGGGVGVIGGWGGGGVVVEVVGYAWLVLAFGWGPHCEGLDGMVRMVRFLLARE